VLRNCYGQTAINAATTFRTLSPESDHMKQLVVVLCRTTGRSQASTADPDVLWLLQKQNLRNPYRHCSVKASEVTRCIALEVWAALAARLPRQRYQDDAWTLAN
jgi:hypothetical protein